MVWAVWDTRRAVLTKPLLSHVCGSPEGPLLCLNEIHWFWSLHSEAELYLLAVYLSQYRPNTTQPLQLFATLTPDAPVQSGCHWKRQIEFYGCICSTSCSQCIILSLQKKHFYQKKREKTTTTAKSYGICQKLVGRPMVECHKDNSPLMLPKVGIFKMLLNVHFFFISLIIHELKIIKGEKSEIDSNIFLANLN